MVKKLTHIIYGEGSLGYWFDDRLRWSLGDGIIRKFWKDRWVGDESPCNRFSNCILSQIIWIK